MLRPKQSGVNVGVYVVTESQTSISKSNISLITVCTLNLIAFYMLIIFICLA
jgi:hypothetical protein